LGLYLSQEEEEEKEGGDVITIGVDSDDCAPPPHAAKLNTLGPKSIYMSNCLKLRECNLLIPFAEFYISVMSET